MGNETLFFGGKMQMRSPKIPQLPFVQRLKLQFIYTNCRYFGFLQPFLAANLKEVTLQLWKTNAIATPIHIIKYCYRKMFFRSIYEFF
ncbi:hypothetical protein [Nostoc sp.]|uniref:hypothetical protein n=1 Tax=Nostoc sp. TaxID=1180 RepID=UPI002FF99F68